MRKIESIVSKTMIISIVMLVIIAMIAMLSINRSVFASEAGTVTADNVNFRQKASSSAEIIQSLKKGVSLTVEGTEGDFYKVRYNSILGYVSKQFVKVNTSESSNGDSKNSDNKNNNDNSSNNNDNQNVNNEETENNVDNNTDSNSGSSNESSETLTEKEALEKNKTKIKNETEVYVLPLLNSSKLGTIGKDEEVMLVSINGKWAYVRGSKKSGWVNKENLESQTIYLPKESTKISSENTNKETGKDANDANENADASETKSSSTTNDKENSDSSNSNNGKDNADNDGNGSNNDNNNGNNNGSNNNDNNNDNNNNDNSNNNNSNTKKTMYINVDAVNIRKEASTTATILNSVEKNTALEVLDTSNSEWYKIKTPSGTVGYVLAKYLSETKK